MSRIQFLQDGVHIALDWSDGHPVRLIHLSAVPFEDASFKEESARWFNLVELSVTGEGSDEHHAFKHLSERPSASLRYRDMSDFWNGYGRKLEIRQIEERLGLEVISHLQFYDGIQAVSSWTEVVNRSGEPVGLEYVSSFCLAGLAKESEDYGRLLVHVAHNSWCGEAQWRAAPVKEWGIAPVSSMSTQRLSVSTAGAWSCLQYLPMGAVENPSAVSTLLWQIEHNGSWQWEISDISPRDLYLRLSGPTEQESGWYKRLMPGERFESVRCALAACAGGFEDALRQMTRYRRATRRACADNHDLSVVFNDYIQFDGKATAKELEPMIDVAAEMGCECFCLDCGWYTDGWWWNGVGNWTPSEKKFPKGLSEPVDRIHSRGMKAGLWLELEVMSVGLELAENLPDDWFFIRHGRRVVNHGRYQLDFRNPDVRAFADGVVDRIIATGFDYLKLDYNIESGIGTERGADSVGDGLLMHNRAVLSFVDGVLSRHPDLLIENVSSGGLRMDWATLSRSALQSCTDQGERDKLAAIALASVSAVPPEQCGAWCLPFPGTAKEAAFSLTSVMLLRPCLSGDCRVYTGDNLALVKAGIECYKRIRSDIPRGLPFYPLGMPRIGDECAAFGLTLEDKAYLAVFRMKGDGAVRVPLSGPAAREARAIFPENPPRICLDASAQTLEVCFEDALDAVLIEVKF
jgi:alpha-galactosidase